MPAPGAGGRGRDGRDSGRGPTASKKRPRQRLIRMSGAPTPPPTTLREASPRCSRAHAGCCAGSPRASWRTRAVRPAGTIRPTPSSSACSHSTPPRTTRPAPLRGSHNSWRRSRGGWLEATIAWRGSRCLRRRHCARATWTTCSGPPARLGPPRLPPLPTMRVVPPLDGLVTTADERLWRTLQARGGRGTTPGSLSFPLAASMPHWPVASTAEAGKLQEILAKRSEVRCASTATIK